MTKPKSIPGIFRMYVNGHTYEQIGRYYGLSRQRIQQIVRPPKEIYDAVKERAKGHCEQCKIVTDGHVHHVQAPERTIYSVNDIKYLQYVCPTCHRILHRGWRKDEDIKLSCIVHCVVDEDTRDRLFDLAKKLGVSVSKLIRTAVERFLAERQ